jgi:hypothetical protein
VGKKRLLGIIESIHRLKVTSELNPTGKLQLIPNSINLFVLCSSIYTAIYYNY